MGDTPVITATVTNQGKPSVTIEKQVEGNMGDQNAVFEFSILVKGADEQEINIDGTYNNVQIQNGLFSLKDDEHFTIPNLPIGSTVTVTELSTGDGYTTTVSKNGETPLTANGITFDPEGNTRILFTNTKGVNIPTGIFSDYYPYLMMLAIAAIGTTGFIYPTCRRRRHKGDR